MRFRLDSSLADDGGWTTPPTRAERVLIGRASGAELREVDGAVVKTWDDPLAALAWLDAQRRPGGRWVGFLSYELGRLLEPAVGGASRAQETDLPLFVWGLSASATAPGFVATSRVAAETDCVAWQRSYPPDARAAPSPTLVREPSARAPHSLEVSSSLTRSEYFRAVQRCLDYIAAGDVFQVNLSQRLVVDCECDAASLYNVLQERAPAAYGALLELGEVAILSNSPELFLRVTADRRIITRPIKGTRPNGPGLAHLARELRDSAKDAAELNMIVDLERNDLGRVCGLGSVRVTQPRTIETHPTVFHGVAQIEGKLREDVGLVDLLRATFPGGSVTGAPKIRAMQIIDELEPVGRGVYCGAIGHLDADGSLQLNLAIRTMTLDSRTGMPHIPVGGGIVAESDPAAEYEETWVKARAALDALASLRGPAARSVPRGTLDRGGALLARFPARDAPSPR